VLEPKGLTIVLTDPKKSVEGLAELEMENFKWYQRYSNPCS